VTAETAMAVTSADGRTGAVVVRGIDPAAMPRSSAPPFASPTRA
jgi:hypothetical protein